MPPGVTPGGQAPSVVHHQTLLAVGQEAAAVRTRSAPGSELERSAHLAHSVDGQAGDLGAEQLLGDEREVVERERTLLRHPIAGFRHDLGRDLPDRPRRRSALSSGTAAWVRTRNGRRPASGYSTRQISPRATRARLWSSRMLSRTPRIPLGRRCAPRSLRRSQHRWQRPHPCRGASRLPQRERPELVT